ncbi:hypothetical protein PVAR5_1113 [Paecilomyces variotii No. 5]|uniref:Uncharacterized protein n=1 Tax=Byssochlamys spectabilis (strain No. 5 / NBRC 109023) TaxID=1356009 RepID=V5HST9_BYSSN|nr:hypothetical protein PVAR5_1113 [Paecilomyces variotii No. 5]
MYSPVPLRLSRPGSITISRGNWKRNGARLRPPLKTKKKERYDQLARPPYIDYKQQSGWVDVTPYRTKYWNRYGRFDRMAGAISSSLQQFLSALRHRTVGESSVGGDRLIDRMGDLPDHAAVRDAGEQCEEREEGAPISPVDPPVELTTLALASAHEKQRSPIAVDDERCVCVSVVRSLSARAPLATGPPRPVYGHLVHFPSARPRAF